MVVRVVGIAFAVLLCAAVQADDAVTILGTGNGDVTIIEKDGTVRKLTPENTTFLNVPGKDRLAAKERKARQEAERRAREEEQARLKAEQDLEARRKKLEEEKARAAEEAAAREKALREQQETRQKEIQHYNDKDYTYGPGSAEKVDNTGAVVKKKQRDDEAGVRNVTGRTGSRLRHSRVSR